MGETLEVVVAVGDRYHLHLHLDNLDFVVCAALQTDQISIHIFFINVDICRSVIAVECHPQ